MSKNIYWKKRCHYELKDALDKNKLYATQIEAQKSEILEHNEQLQTNQAVLQKSHQKLKNILTQNKTYFQQIEEQKEVLQNSNEELMAKEEEIRQNFEELHNQLKKF